MMSPSPSLTKHLGKVLRPLDFSTLHQKLCSFYFIDTMSYISIVTGPSLLQISKHSVQLITAHTSPTDKLPVNIKLIFKFLFFYSLPFHSKMLISLCVSLCVHVCMPVCVRVCMCTYIKSFQDRPKYKNMKNYNNNIPKVYLQFILNLI